MNAEQLMREGSMRQDEVEISSSPARRVRVVRGLGPVLAWRTTLVRLAAHTGQTGAMDDLEFFLRLPQSKPKEPCLVLFGPETGAEEFHDGEAAPAEEIAAAVLLFQYRVLGMGCRVYSTADTTGRRTVIAPAPDRARIAVAASRQLLQEGAQICLLTLTQPAGYEVAEDLVREELRGFRGARWSLERREVPLFLPLAETLDATLARIGQRTRSNLRYYRRRAEKDLGCTFVADAALTTEEFVAFNRLCKYAVTDELATWRMQALQIIRQPFLHGIRDGDGRWLALVGGRRQSHEVEIDWQCNRADLPAYSLSTVIRSYLIEHEIKLRSKRLYIEGGTPNPIQQSFSVEGAMDLTVVRRTLYTRAIRRLSPKKQFPKNHVSQVIADPDLTWHRA